MADNLRWWKLWTTAPSDPTILALAPALRWAWAALGAYTKAHGDSGMLLTTRDNPVLAIEMGVDPQSLESTLRVLPSVRVEESKNRRGYLAVTWNNWIKYQEDSSQSERRKASRLKRRGEEKRGDEKREPPLPPRSSEPLTPTALPDPLPVAEPDPSLQRPPVACAAGTPEYVSACPACAAMLRLLCDLTGRAYGAPGRAGLWMHMAHERSGLDASLAAIRSQAKQLVGGERRFLAPGILFKPENWDVTVNEPREPKRKTVAEKLREKGLDG